MPWKGLNFAQMYTLGLEKGLIILARKDLLFLVIKFEDVWKMLTDFF